MLVWVVSVIVLGICGAHKPEGIWVILSRVGTLYYFVHFLVILPILGKLERPLPLPESISHRCSAGGGPLPSGATAKPMEKADARAAFRCWRAPLLVLAVPARSPAMAQEEVPTPPSQNWSFDGLFGTFDLAAAQRGFQVYFEVCSNCHSMEQLHYRDLTGIGLDAGTDQGDRRRRSRCRRDWTTRAIRRKGRRRRQPVQSPYPLQSMQIGVTHNEKAAARRQ